MVITDHLHLIIFRQQLTVRVCACIRTDRTCTHRTTMVCTTYGDNPGLSQLQLQQLQHEQHYEQRRQR